MKKDDMYFEGAGHYAAMYIKPRMKQVKDFYDMLEVVHHFLIEYSESNNDAKKKAIEMTIFPIYKGITGRNYDVNLIAL